MIGRILAIIITCLIIGIIYLIIKHYRGLNMRYGIVGLGLLILPRALEAVQYFAVTWYSIALAIATLAGIILILVDIPKYHKELE